MTTIDHKVMWCTEFHSPEKSKCRPPRYQTSLKSIQYFQRHDANVYNFSHILWLWLRWLHGNIKYRIYIQPQILPLSYKLFYLHTPQFSVLFPHFVLPSGMPVVWLLPEENWVPTKEGLYKCPQYKNPACTGTLFTIGHYKLSSR
jgi:hypothetical protein